jgi:hypothetical protein
MNRHIASHPHSTAHLRCDYQAAKVADPFVSNLPGRKCPNSQHTFTAQPLSILPFTGITVVTPLAGKRAGILPQGKQAVHSRRDQSWSADIKTTLIYTPMSNTSMKRVVSPLGRLSLDDKKRNPGTTM